MTKAKKQEKVYSDAIEQLQAEQDALEAENGKLRKGQGVDLRDGSGGAVVEVALPTGLESSQLSDQVRLSSDVREWEGADGIGSKSTLCNPILEV